MITPAITVLGAVEGLKVTTPLFDPYVVSITVVILIGVFAIQRFGTHLMEEFLGTIEKTLPHAFKEPRCS